MLLHSTTYGRTCRGSLLQPVTSAGRPTTLRFTSNPMLTYDNTIMNITFLIRSLAKTGGVEHTLIDKVNYLASKGHTVSMLTYEQGQHPMSFYLDETVKHYDLECRFFKLYRYSYIVRQFKGFKLKSIFRKRLQTFLKDSRTQVLVVTTYSQEFMSDIISVSKQIPIVVESHSAYFHDNPNKTVLHWLKNLMFIRTIKKSNLLIALTKGDAKDWKRYIRNVITLPNPLSYYCDEATSLPRIDKRIVCAGSLHAPKRFDLLISAFSKIADRCPSWYVDIFGEGEDRSKLEKQIRDLSLENRIFLKSQTNDIFSEYKSSQFCVISSDFEGFSLVLIEAMGCGLPVVSTACPYGPQELIENGVTGILSEMNIEDLAEKIEWMATHDAERKAMGNNAHLAAAQYKKEKVMPMWESAYYSVL